MSEQSFYCKQCKEQFTITSKTKYWNYNCPKCNIISLPKSYVGVTFRGLDTIRN